MKLVSGSANFSSLCKIIAEDLKTHLDGVQRAIGHAKYFNIPQKKLFEYISDIDTVRNHFLELQGYLRSLYNSNCTDVTEHSSNSDYRPHVSLVDPPPVFVFKNGKQVAMEHISALREEDFDLILNIPEHSLKVRVDNENGNRLEPVELGTMGPHRIQLLRYLVTNLGKALSLHDFQKISVTLEDLSKDALLHYICIFRRLLRESGSTVSYIKTVPQYGDGKKTSAYAINVEKSYLVISKKCKFPLNFPQDGTLQ